MNAGSLEPGQLSRLLDVGRGMVSELDLESVLRQVLDAARDLTGARYAALGVLDDDKRELERFVYTGIDEETRQRIGPLPRGLGILGELIRDPRPLRLARISDHPRSYGFPAEHPEMTTFAGTPVMIRGEAYGNLYLSEKEGGEEFSERDEELLIVLAEWAAIAIDNARTHESSERRRRELERAVRGLEANVDLSRQLGAETRLDRALELVVKRGRALVEARTCAVLLHEDGRLKVADAAGESADALRGESADPETSPFLDTLRSGIAQRVGRRAFPLGGEPLASMLVPLRSRGATVGLILALDPLEGEEFSDDDELVLSAFAISAGHGVAGAMAVEDERLRLSIEASEQERRRWARELHDETLQELGGLKLALGAAARLDDLEEVRAAIAAAAEQVGSGITQLRHLITELRPASLDELGTGPALEALVERTAVVNGLEVSLELDLDYESGRESSRHAPAVETTIYRLVQEALTNAVKHAKATRVKVVVVEQPESIDITVSDDGVGFDPEQGVEGFGLIGMRERASLMDGTLSVVSQPELGTTIRCRIPGQRASQPVAAARRLAS
jgi:signal transduction histidine kinase